VWKTPKTLIFRFYWELCGKRLRVFSPRRGVFVTQGAQRLRKGRKGFASFAQGRWRLRIKTGSRRSSQSTRSPCALCEASAPLALQKHRNAVKKHASFFHTIPSRTKIKN
jgi:hypothetical protein